MISLLSLVALVSLLMALVPALMVRDNLRVFRAPKVLPGRGTPQAVSVLIPARDEENTIEASVSAALAGEGVEVEVLVLDDRSRDATAEIVQAMARSDRRVRLVSGQVLPPGWCGKQHACWTLAREARHHLLVFIDADVRLEPDALARMAWFLDESGADLASGFPRQETIGLLEKLVIPLMHFILLGFLPIARMRRSRDPIFAAGCGQLIITRREAYARAGGHSAIRGSLHDGVKLPRAYRRAGLRTDVFDATDLAVCRMYHTAGAVWSGLAKNAGEGLATPRLLLPVTGILLAGQVFPVLFIAAGLAAIPVPWGSEALVFSSGAMMASYYSRWMTTIRFRQSWLGAMLHPLGVLILVMIQWYAFARNLAGRPSAWKGRLYPPRPAIEPSRWESTTS
jgi:hypothetical protein